MVSSELDGVCAFLEGHPDFDLRRLDLHAERGRVEAALDEDGGDCSWEDVAGYQRLLRLLPETAFSTEEEQESVAALQARHFFSAHDIAALSPAQFVARTADDLPGGERQASAIHRRARQTRDLLAQMALAVRSLVASPHARAQPSHNAADVIAYFEQLPSYRQMFGSLDYCVCEQCQSIFGPAAYLVDLLRIVDTYIEPANDIPHDWKLQTRRPDLYTTPLDCAATDTPIPYLSLVNSLLSDQIEERAGSDNAYKVVAAAPYPFNLPFSRPQAELRDFLAALATSLDTVYAAFVAPPPATSAVPAIAVARESLFMSIEQFDIVTTPRTVEAQLAPYYGYADAIPLAELAKVAVFLYRTGLTRDQLVELLTQGLSTGEIDDGVADLFFINATGEGLPAMRLVYRDVGGELTEHIADLSLLRLDRLNRFIRLHALVGPGSAAAVAMGQAMSFADLQWALTAAGGTPIEAATIASLAGLVQLSAASGAAAVDATSLWHDLKTDGRGNGPYPADPFDRIFNPPVLLEGRDPYTSPEPIPFDPARPLAWRVDATDATNAEIRARLGAALQVSNDDLNLIAHYLLGLLGKTGGELETDLATLSWLYRLARLARLGKMRVDNLLRLLGLIFYPAQPWRRPEPGAWTPTQPNVALLLDTARWLKGSEFDVYQLQYILTGELSPQVSPGYRVADIPKLIDRTTAAAVDDRLVIDDLIYGDIDAERARLLHAELVARGFINAAGLVLAVPAGFAELSPLLPIGEDAFQRAGIVTLAESKTAFADLVTNALILAPAGAAAGALSAAYTSATPLDFLFPGDPDAAAKRDQVRLVLVARKSDIDALVGIVAAAASAQQAVALTGLGEFFNALAERVALLAPVASAIASLPDWRAAMLTPRPPNSLPAGLDTFIASLARYLRLVDLLPLDLTQIEALVRSPASFNIADLKAPTVANVRSLSAFVALEASLQDENNELVRCYFAILPDAGCEGGPVEVLARLSGWPAAQIEQMIALFWPDNALSPAPWQTVVGLELLQRVFSLCTRLGLEAQGLLQVAQLSEEELLDSSGQLLPAAWTLWNERAQAVLAAVAGRYGDQFDQVYGKIESARLSVERDALLGYAIWILGKADLPIHSTTELFDYFLIDVEMGGGDVTSWGAQAIQSVQLYIQRCRLQQEPAVTRIPVPEIWWSWLSEYRVWEANRRIFVYPENYVDPELVKNNSPIFRTFAEDLRQNDIDDLTVAAAYTRYFDEFSTAANLVPAASLRERPIDPDTGTGDDSLFFVGRSLTEPYSYQIRSLIDGRRWTPWQAIDLSIASSSVSVAYAFGRLLLFWAERERVNSSAVDQGTAAAQSTSRATLKYSFENAAGEWVQPQVLYDSYVIAAEPDDYPPTKNPAIAALFADQAPGWESPQVLRIGRGIPAQGRLSVVQGETGAAGVETNFAHEVRKGDRIWVAGQERAVTDVQATTLTVNDVWTMTATQAEFKVIPPARLQTGFRSFQGVGKISFTGGLTVISGSGTDFLAQIQVGDRVSAKGETRTVLLVLVNGAQQLVVDFAWPTSSGGPIDYTITPMSAGADRLLVLYGSALSTAKRVPDPPQPTPEPNPGHDPFITALNTFNRDLYQTLVLADRIGAFIAPGTGAAVGGTVTAGLAIQLTDDLIPNIGRALILDYPYGADYAQLQNLQPYAPHLDRNNNILSIVPSSNVIADTVWGNVTAEPQFYAPGPTVALSAPASLPLLYNLPDRVSAVHNVVNQTGWMVYGNGTDAYLIQSEEAGLIDTTTLTFVRPYLTSGIYRNELAISTGPYTTQPRPFADLKFRFTRISTSVVARLSSILFARGLDGLLRLETQYLPEAPFSRFYSDATNQPAPAIDATQLPSELIDFNGAYGQYFWEVFFYGPFLIASRLNGHQRFEQAKQWYQYIFNPTQEPESESLDSADRYWRFRPFRPLDVESLAESLTNVEQIDVYNDDPFDPDAIARLRPGSYPKAIFERYVANLLDWGDRQFTIDTRESIASATNIYLMATELLGPRPLAVGDCERPEPRSYAQIQAAYDTSGTAAGAGPDTLVLDDRASDKDRFYNGLYLAITTGTGNGQRRTVIGYDGATRTATVDADWDPMPAAGSGYRISGVPQFLIDMENGGVNAGGLAGPGLTELPYNMLDSYFCVPDNPDLIALWDRVEDRLFKIRHGLDINGVARPLPLFAPPIDPHALARAAGAEGMTAGGEGAMAQPPASPYRFEYLIGQAQGVTSTVIQFGQSLLLALEKRDAEALGQLQNTQTDTLLRLTRIAKESALAEARQQLEALQIGQQAAQWRQAYYQALLDTGLSVGERQNLDAMADGLAFNLLATVTKTAASIAYAIPNLGSPFAMTYGGIQIGAALNAASNVLEVGSVISSYIAQRSLTVAGYERRDQDWALQATLAGYEVEQTGPLIAAAELRVLMAEQELVLLDEQVAQNQVLGKLLRQKFTNLQLYEWMSRQLSGLYLQIYQVAEQLARAAQRAYEYRLGTGRNFIPASTWDNLYKGLLAGEGLQLALTQLERAWLDDNRRRFEIVKTVALSQLDPQQLLALRETGKCVFALSELLFDQDYPGHYQRTISNVTVSIPAVLGPYQNLKATLTQLGNQVVVEPNIEAVTFLMTGAGAGAFPPRALRSDWRARQRVVLSRGLDDSGLFELDAGDPRFLPFEGTGAVSSWELSIPPQTNQFDFSGIADVVLQIRYTALEDKKLYDDLIALPAMSVYSGASLLLLRQMYPQPWYAFMTDHEAAAEAQVLKFPLAPSIVPAHVSDAEATGFYLQLELAEGVSVPVGSSFVRLRLTPEETVPVTFGPNAAALVTLSAPVAMEKLFAQPLELEFVLASTPADLKRDAYLDPEKLLGIGLILDFTASIDW